MAHAYRLPYVTSYRPQVVLSQWISQIPFPDNSRVDNPFSNAQQTKTRIETTAGSWDSQNARD